MKKFGAAIFLFAALSLAVGGKLFEDDKSLSEIESLLADYKREEGLDTKQSDFTSKSSSEGLGPVISDEDKPRIPSKPNLEQLGTRDTDLPEKRTSLMSERNVKRHLENSKRVLRKKSESTHEISDAKEKKEVKEIMRDENKPRIPSRSDLEKLGTRDTALTAKRTSLTSERHMKNKLADFKRVAKKEKESAKAKKEAKEKKPKEKTPGIVVKNKPFENAKELAEKAEKVTKFLKEHPCPTPEESFYNITVYTADKLLAGTNSKVYIDLYGSLFNQRQSTGKIRLTNGKKANEFERAGVDSFTIKATFVGIVKRITVEHDNSGFFSDWNLLKIVVNDLKLGTTHTFTCDCELSGYDNTKTLPPV